MALLELFSKRRKRERGEFPDIYTYEEIPRILRVQFVHIIRELFFQDEQLTERAKNILEEIHQILCREYGVFHLTGKDTRGFEVIGSFVLAEKDHEKVLDTIELLLRFANNEIRNNSREYNRGVDVDRTIAEVNGRFREAGVGYQFEAGEIVRMDSQLLHKSAVRPALFLLRDPIFSLANQEFLNAHEFYRAGKYLACISEANKSLDSMLKIICFRKKWPYHPDDPTDRLISICLENELIPEFMHNQLTAMQTILESRVPTVTTRDILPQQGKPLPNIPPYIAEYVMHLTATTLLMLGQATRLNN